MFPIFAVVYDGRGCSERWQVHLQDGVVLGEELREIRISHYSPPSERCPPLAVLHTVSSAGICFKLESTVKNQDSPLSLLHASCLRENKTAVASIGGGEVHLVAMHSRKFEGQNPCFWGFNVASSLYNSCLVMLNLRCLGIVFDLDETLIVANTMRSFEDRIEALQRKINTESDPQRASGMLAEVKRYQEDKNILKQYAESDQVIENGKVIKSQSEVVPALSESHQPIVRPLVRLQDRNIILTRINPLIRDTSVLVRLRPAWEDLRSYLTARGRKRFEVFVCTMAERDYALEMWRLLDPESNLINSKELLERIVCVKSGKFVGSRKSLFNVFQTGNCHPKMSLVIDDRLKVWDEKDQPRVHVVPAFAPYYAPQAEANNTVPVLCVARNVACNVRGGFFKEFDDGMLQRISEVAYEDDVKHVPSSPDVSHYLVSEDDPSALNGNRDSIGFDGMADAEVERRLKEAMSASSSSPVPIANLDPRIASALHYAVPSSSFTAPPLTIQGSAMSFPSQQLPQVTSLLKPLVTQLGQVETTLHSSPATEEGEVRESELDPDTRRRLLILQHGQDMREPPPGEPQFPARPPVPVSVPRAQPRGWFPVEEEMSPRQLNRVAQPLNAESLPIDKNRGHHPPFLQKVEPSIPPGRVVLENQRLPKEALQREDQLRLNQSVPDFHPFSGGDGAVAQLSSANKDIDLEAGQIDPYTETCTGALQDIAYKCGTKVEYRQSILSSTELQFLVEVLFAGERVGEGIGRTRREAQLQAAEGSLLYLADKYLSQLRPDSSYEPGDGGRFANQRDNGFVNDANSFGYQSLPKDEGVYSTAPPRILDPRIEASKRQSTGPIAALKDLCMMEGLGVAFQTQPQFSANPGLKNEVYAQVEVNGQVLGKGIGLTWDEAKSEAAEKALVALKSMLGQFPYRHQGSPRSMQGIPSKRMKQEFPRIPQRMPSSGR
ncbi:RNA polymerase ii c-terminal domain phosphatase-like 1 [Phtheirospermum japonicum]|uniref:protein-serine/threonine phosphatase n=1 Tax=Phtheirospermum japonicum TaxID=374723 RepID=A0A830CCH0_9LAMI|nr:RNA polymerase ii c-terminal domain phosphatase-like 1 [Phtheirospermum japonicum]